MFRYSRRSCEVPLELVLITDVGPDPDDVKALLVAAINHIHGCVSVRA